MRNLLPIALLLFVSAGMVAAQTAIPLVNPSFESPSIAPSTHVAGQAPDGWGILSFALPSHEMIVADPVKLFGEIDPMPVTPDGAQFVGLWSDSNMQGFLYQNTGIELHAGITYSVTGYLAGGIAALMGVGCADTPTGPINTSIQRICPSAHYYTWPTDWESVTTSGTMTTGDTRIGKYLCVFVRAWGWVGVDNVSLTSLDLGYGDVSGSITLSDYTGDLKLCPVKIELIQPAGSTTIVATQYVWPTASTGSVPYFLEAVAPGTYDIRFSASKWLKHSLKSFVMTSANQTGVNVTLINGDVDGSNVIDTDTDISLKNIDQKGD